MKKLLALSVVVLVACSGFAQEKPARFNFDLNGFSIAPLEGTSDSITYQVVTMFLPSTGGFSPNVNIQVQPYDGTMVDYSALSKKQFESMGWTLIEEKTLSPTAITLEYTGTVQGYVLHFYARAESREGKVYLTTGVATKEQWPNQSPQIKKCVNSFKFEQKDK